MSEVSDGDFSTAGREEVSMEPSLADFGRYCSRVPGGWTGSYSSVASFPANERIALPPPGWVGRKEVTYEALRIVIPRKSMVFTS